MPSPSARSLKHLREQGWQVAMVEKWNSYAKIRQDVWGFADALGCRTQIMTCTAAPYLLPVSVQEIALFQFTTTPNMSAREKKIRVSKEAAYWLNCGGKIYLHGWSKKGPREKRKVWTLMEREVQL